MQWSCKCQTSYLKGGVVKARKEFERWVKENPDPLKILADQCLDPILNRFGLKVGAEIDLKLF